MKRTILALGTTEVKPLNGQASAEELAVFKTKYPKGFFSIANETDIAYFRKPDRAVMNYAMSQATTEAPLNYYEDILRDTKIGGSDSIVSDDDMFFGAVNTLKEILDGSKATLVKH